MRLKITAGENTWLIAGESQAQADGNYQGRLLNELKLSQSLTALGSAPVTLNISVRNDDGYISSAIDLWGATVEITTDSGTTWTGTITAYDSDGDGITYLVATEKAAPELTIQMPDEVARLVTVDANFHSSAVNVTLPLVFGGNSTTPHLVKGILIDKTAGIYLLCVGEIHQVVKVYRGTEEITTGFTAYTGTAGQANYAGFAYVQLTDEAIRKNDDGSYAEISADVIGLKLGSATIEQCRNGARVLYYLLTTAKEGVCGWGLGIGTSEINTTAFNQAISDVDTAGLKFDGIFYFRQAAQSWIDQICLAIRGAYSIGRDGERALYINKSAASAKTYTENNMRMLRHGVGAYTGRVYNKGKLDFDYNPITGQFMQSAQYEDTVSVAAIGEQEFYGQSYLIKDMATAQAIVEYTCKKSLIGARKVYFETDELPTGARSGTVITVTRADLGISGDYQITSLEIGDHIHTIEAEKFDASIFAVGTPGTAIDWTKDPPIISPVLPGAASGLTLATDVEYDSSGDGTATPYISGAFTLPEGKYLGAAIFWGEGATPSTWNSVTIKGNEFRIKPVRAGQQYTVKVQMFNQSGTSATITGSIVAGSHAALPPTPTIAAATGLGCIVVNIAISAFAALSHFEIQRQKSDGSGLTTIASEYRGTSFTDDDATILADYENLYQYRVRAVSRSGQPSAWTSFTTSISATQLKNKDVSADQFIGKHFTTAKDVGLNQDGVKFTADGLEMWQDGALKVLIPASGNPEFAGILTAAAGYIGGWKIFPGYLESGNLRLDSAGSIQTVDFVSGHRGWKQDNDGNAEFNNIRARGAVKTAVFEKDEISVVGGRTLIRPAAVVKDYDYSVFLAGEAQAYFNDCLDILDDILDTSSDLIPVSFADYDEYEAFEAACYREVVTALGYAVYGAGIAEAVYDESAKNAYWTLCWSRLNDILDETNETPSFAAQTYAQFVTAETGYFESAADIADDPPEFVPGISSDDTQIHLDTTDGFIVGEVIRIKDGISNDYWATISEIGEDDGGDYIKTVGQYGSLFDLTAGQTVVSYGGAGAGGVLLDGQAPLIDVYTHDGQPWDGTDCRVRIGNLKGWGTINHDVYGIAIGNPAGEYLVYDTITGSLRLNGQIQISGGSGLSNLSDAGALAGKDDIDLSYVTDSGALAGKDDIDLSYITDAGAVAAADDLDDISDGATHKKTTQNEKTGAGRAYSSLDSSNRLVTAVIPGTAITPAGAGLFLGSNYMGFHNGLDWKTYMDNQGNFALVGSGTHGLSWNAGTGVLSIAGSVSILSGSGYGNLTDKPTSLAGINSTEGSKLSGIAAGADVTANNTSYDTARVAGTAAATVLGGATKANAALDANNKLITAVIPGAAVTPAGSGLFMGSNYMGFHDGANWKTYLDSNGNFALVGSGTHGLSWNAGTGVLTIAGSMTILGGSGYGNLTDKPTSLSGINSAEGSKLTGIEAGADVTSTHTAYDTARVDGTAASTVKTNASTALANAATAQSTADNAATAASNAQTSANTANNLLADIAADNKFTPAEKQATKKEWDVIVSEKTKNDDQADAFSVSKTAYGNAYTTLSSYIASLLADLTTTDTIVGTDFRANFKAYYDARTDLLNAIAAKAKTLADTAQATATNAGAAAAAAQTTANNAATAASNAQTSANTANSLLANIADDNKFTPVEKQAARKEWEIIAAEKTLNNAQAFEFVGFSAGITEAGYGESAKNAYWTTCWNKLNDLIDETNAVPGFAVQTYSDFVAEESGYYDTELDVIYDLPISAPALLSVVDANNAYNVAFQTLATYLNDGMTYSSGVPFWLADANLGETWPIVGATFRATWKAYYDARTTLLNSIAARAKALADAAQAAAGIGAEHAATAHAPSDADHTQTTIDGGLVTTGTLQVVQGGTVAAGITGNTAGDTAVRFFAGSTFANRASAPFRVLQNGAIYATSATISGTITSGSGSQIAGFTATTTDLTAGTSTTAIGISADTAKKAFWAGSTTPASAPFYVEHDGDGKLGGFTFASNGLSATSTASINISTYNVSVNIFNAGVTDTDALGLATKAVLSTNSGVWAVSTIAYGEISCGYRDGSTSNYSAVGGLGRNGDGISNAPFRAGVASGARYGFWTNGKVDAAGGFTSLSDERLKQDIKSVKVLDKLARIRVMQYRHDGSKIRERLSKKQDYDTAEDSQIRIGVMAAEFNAAFGVNNQSTESICLNDQIGVALRAIQELAEIVDEQKAEIAELRTALKLPEKPKKVKEEPAAELTEAEIIETIDKNIEPILTKLFSQSQEAIN